MNLKLNILIVFLVIFCTNFVNSNSLPPNVTNLVKYNEPKIVGGINAKMLGNEHIASIRLKMLDYAFGRGHLCGGSLINSRTVLTASHCFFNLDYLPPKLRKATDFKVVMGTLDKSVRTFETFESSIEKIVVHPNFSMYTMVNDVGLMILSKPVPKNHPNIKPIQLAEKLPPRGTKCKVDGWGAIRYGSIGVNRLQTVNINIIDWYQCKGSYNDRLLKGMFCAGNWIGGQDSCQGDSGGPLTYNNTLIGIVSWGDKCGVPRFPGIYSDVSYFKNWIENSSNNNFKTIYYITFIIICQFFINIF